jgi:glycosyltransferase involved in cell wall biosynthesis
MNILIIHNEYSVYGGEDRAVNLQAKVLAKKHTVYEYIKSNKNYKRKGFIKNILAGLNIIYSLSSKRDVNDILKKNKIDVVLVHNLYPLISPSVLSTIKKYNIPIVMTLHNYRLKCVNGLFLREGRICEKCADRNSIWGMIYNCKGNILESIIYSFALTLHNQLRLFDKYIDVFIAPSKFVKEKLCSYGINKKKIVVIPHFQTAINTLESCIGDYALFVGRLSKEKGIYTLIDAFKDISDKKLIVVGDGPERKKLEKIIRKNQLENVELVGFKNGAELEQYYLNCKFVIVPSECYEVFGYINIESFKYKKPVIGANAGAIPEIIEDGKTGLIFKSGNKADLIDKVNQLWYDNDKIKIMGEETYKRLQLYYTEEKYSQALENIFTNFSKIQNS